MTQANTPLLVVDQLAVSLGPVRPVAGISFALRAGETFALLGESGCGKSMTALALMRLLPDGAQITDGKVGLAGEDLLALSEAAMCQRRGRRLAMIFQEPGTSLNPVLTIGQQIGESLSLHRQLRGDAQREAGVALLQAVGIPDPARRWNEYPFQLSGGMKQRAMIAMALAGEPEILIADEPTTALDVTIQAQVLDLLRRLQAERGMGLLMISHDLGVVSRMADQVGVMYAGELVEVASRQAFFAQPAHPYAQRLMAALPDVAGRGKALTVIPGRVPALDRPFPGCRFVDRCDRALHRCQQQVPELVTLADGRQVRCFLYQAGDPAVAFPLPPAGQTPPPAIPVPGAGAEPAPALLTVQDLQVHFPIRRGLLQRVKGQVYAVDGVGLTVQSGETLALVGESGCGKTTLGKALLRMIEPTGGQVSFAGQSLQGLRGRALNQARQGMQMVFQDPLGSLNPRMRVGQIIREGMEALKMPGDHGLRVGELLAQVGLAPEMADRYPHEFSGGQRQRIAIARALAVNPRLLVCDEPTSALDVSVQAQVLNLLKSLQRQLGLAYLFITHNIAVVDYLADRVAVMYLGRIVEQGNTASVLRHSAHPYTQALISAVPRVQAASAAPVSSSSAQAASMSVGGDLPSPSAPPVGCHFHPRCPHANERCRQEYPLLREIRPAHWVACHLA